MKEKINKLELYTSACSNFSDTSKLTRDLKTLNNEYYNKCIFYENKYSENPIH